MTKPEKEFTGFSSKVSPYLSDLASRAGLRIGMPKSEANRVIVPLKLGNFAGFKKDGGLMYADGGRINYALGGGANMENMINDESMQIIDLIQSIDDPEKKVNTSIMFLMKMGEDAIPLLKEALTELEFGAMAAKLDEMPDEEIGGGIASLEQGNMMGARQMASMDDDDDMLDPDAMQTDPQELMREIQSQGAVQTARAPSQEGIMSMMRG